MKRILAIFLILILLTCNVGLTYAIHYCGGMAVESAWSLGEQELSCGMGAMDVVQTRNQSNSTPLLEEKDCCDNSFSKLNVDDEFDVDHTGSVQSIAVAFPLITASLLAFTKQHTPATFLVGNSPPWKRVKLSVLLQKFLI